MKNQRKSLGRRDALAELVLDDRNSFPMLLREDVVQERRFPAPEEAGQDRDGDLGHREPARGVFVHRARNRSARRSRVAPRYFFLSQRVSRRARSSQIFSKSLLVVYLGGPPLFAGLVEAQAAAVFYWDSRRRAQFR